MTTPEVPTQRTDEAVDRVLPVDATRQGPVNEAGLPQEVSLESAQLVMGAIHLITTRPEQPFTGPVLDS